MLFHKLPAHLGDREKGLGQEGTKCGEEEAGNTGLEQGFTQLALLGYTHHC